MFDWVLAGVDQRGVPIPQSLLAFGGVKRQTDKTHSTRQPMFSAHFMVFIF